MTKDKQSTCESSNIFYIVFYEVGAPFPAQFKKRKKEFGMGQGVAWHAHKFMKKQDMCHGWHGHPSHI